MMHLTRITSETRLSKHYSLAHNGELVKMPGGNMRSGTAEVLAISDLLELKEINGALTTRQALTFGIPKGIRAGQSVALTTKAGRRFNHGSIARSREHFAFPSGEGILLLDYDPIAGSQPLGPEALREILLPVLGQVEMLITASASSYLFRSEDGAAIKEGGGLHVFCRVANAADIPAIGAAIDGHCWLRGFGRIETSKAGAKLLRGLFDTSVWQPERLSFDAGAACGEGLVQRRPEPSHWAGGSLTLADVALGPEALARVEQQKSSVRGLRILAAKRRVVTARRSEPNLGRSTGHGNGTTPHAVQRVLLHISPDCDYQTWVSVGMALHHAGFVDGYDVWDAWSSHGTGYPGPRVTRYKWDSFGDYGGPKTGLGTLYRIATAWGWSPEPFGRPQLAVRPLPPQAAATATLETQQTLDVSEARQQLRAVLWSIFGQVKKLTKEREETQSKEMRIPLWAVEATTGLSKSSIIRELIPFLRAEKIKTVIVARNKVDAEQYAAAGAFFRRGRANLDSEARKLGLVDGWALGLPHHCPHADKEVASLANGEHTISEMCRGGHCEHGNALMAQQAASEIASRPQSKSVPACTWLPHHKEGQEAIVTVVVAGGLGSGDLESANLVVVDEVTDIVHTRSIGLDEIRAAITRLHKALDRLRDRAALSPLDDLDDEDEAATAKTLETLGKALAMYEAVPPLLAQAAIDTPDGAYQTAEGIRSLVEAAGAFRNRTQAWEAPEWEDFELANVPLRFAQELSLAARTGSISVRDARLEVLYQHPVVMECAGKIPLLLMDATLAPEALSVVEASGGEVTRIVAAQNLHIQCDPRQFRGQMDESDVAFDERIRREISDVQATLRRMAKVKSGFYPVMARKQLAVRLLADATGTDLAALKQMDRKTLWDVSIRAGIGWFGWHDRAHDEWKHADGMLIWGQPVIPSDVWAAKWEGHRALRIQLGLDDAVGLPHWDNEWVAKEWVAVGEYEQQSRCRLPGSPTVRDWMLGELARVRVQAVGRLRGANRAERSLVWFVGGAPLAGLDRYGLAVGSYDRLTPGRSYDERRQATHAARHEAALVAATQLALQGQSVTRAAVQEEMRRTPAICPTTVRDSISGETNTPESSTEAVRHESYSELLEAHKWLAPYLADSGRNAKVVRATRQLLATRGKEIANNLLFKLRVLLFSVGWQWDRLAGFAREVLESTQSDYHEAARWIIDAGLAPPS